MKWVELKPMKHARRSPGLRQVDDDRVVVTGGGRPPEVFSLKANAWSPHEGLPPRAGFTGPQVTMPDGRLLITGGVATYGGGPFEERDSSIAECQLMDPRTRKTEPAGSLVFARHEHSALLLRCGAVLIAGGMHDEESTPTARVELGVPVGVTVPVPGVHEQISRAADEQYLERVVDAGDWFEVERVARKLGDWHRAGEALMKLARYREAADALKRDDLSSPFVLGTLADVYVASGETALALATLDRVIALCEADSTWTHAVLRHARSQRQFLAPCTVGAPNATSADWNNKGAAHSRAGEHAEALRCFDRALKLEADNDYALGNRASALLMLKRPAEALRPARRAIRLRVHDLERRSDGYLVLGIALFDVGRYAASVKAYDQGLALHETPNHWNNRGNSLLKLRRYAKALESFRKATKLGHAQGPWGEAAALCFLGRLDEALKVAAAADPSLEPQMRADPDLLSPYATAA